VLAISLFRVALGPEDLPARRPLGPARGHKPVDVTRHVLDIQRKRHDVPPVAAVLGVDGCVQHLGQVFNGVDDDTRVAPAIGHVPRIDPLQLRKTDGRLHVGHTIIPADHVVDVGQPLLQLQQAQALLDVIPVVAKAPRLPGQVFVVGGDHAALAAGGEGLVLTEAARRDMAQRAGFPAFVSAAERLGIVLYYKELVFLCEGENLVHVADVAVQVDRHDGHGPLRDKLLGRFDADAVVVDIDVGEPRNGPRLHDGKAAGDERVARHNHFVARADAEGR